MSGIRVSFDSSQLARLAEDFRKKGLSVRKEARAVVGRGALNVKNDLRREARAIGVPEAADLARFITYDTDNLTARIGPVKGAAGSFAFFYFGNSKNGPMLPDPVNALDRESDNVERFLGDVGEDML